MQLTPKRSELLTRNAAASRTPAHSCEDSSPLDLSLWFLLPLLRCQRTRRVLHSQPVGTYSRNITYASVMMRIICASSAGWAASIVFLCAMVRGVDGQATTLTGYTDPECSEMVGSTVSVYGVQNFATSTQSEYTRSVSSRAVGGCATQQLSVSSCESFAPATRCLFSQIARRFFIHSRLSRLTTKKNIEYF